MPIARRGTWARPQQCLRFCRFNFVRDPAAFSTGKSFGMGFNWFSSTVAPPGGVPQGDGARCYGTAYDCNNGPIVCNSSLSCVPDTTMCITGQGGGFPAFIYQSPLDTALGGKPNGAGELCHNTIFKCNNGHNPYSIIQPRVLDVPTSAPVALPYSVSTGAHCYSRASLAPNVLPSYAMTGRSHAWVGPPIAILACFAQTELTSAPRARRQALYRR